MSHHVKEDVILNSHHQPIVALSENCLMFLDVLFENNI